MEQIDQGLDRIISKTEDMHRNGAMTVAQLYAQGETMRRALDELDDQEDLLDEADFTLQKALQHNFAESSRTDLVT
eukprot:1360749-Amorphochlora_amoeboformis.AAC.2